MPTPATVEQPALVPEICDRCLEAAPTMSWLIEPLTLGRAQAFILQHILRHRLFSAVDPSRLGQPLRRGRQG